MLYGGGPIGPELSLKLANEYRTDRFYYTNGMTETGPGGTLLHPEDLYARPGSIGRPIAGIEMRLVVDARDARPGEVGEIWLKSPTIMKGYLNNPEATAEVLADGWYKTGDLARSDEDGFLVIALDILRTLARAPLAIEALRAEIELGRRANTDLDRGIDDIFDELAKGEVAEYRARHVAERLALVLQGSLLARHAPQAVADGFIATRLGACRSGIYGDLPRGVDTGTIIARQDLTA